MGVNVVVVKVVRALKGGAEAGGRTCRWWFGAGQRVDAMLDTVLTRSCRVNRVQLLVNWSARVAPPPDLLNYYRSAELLKSRA